MAVPTVPASELSNLLGRWADDPAGLVEGLVAALVRLIDAGLVPAGAVLPPQRSLAAALHVSRGTVSAAYANLDAGGYLVARQGSGTQVRSMRSAPYSPTTGRLFSFTAAPRNVIDLSTGALPASEVAKEVFRAGVGYETGDYEATDGYFPVGLPILRRAISDQLTRDGTPTTPQQILVTAGAQQATWLAINACLSAGDLALVEEPTYRGALEAMRAVGARIEGVPLRRGGIDVAQADRRALRRPALLYCQTGVHNPTGGSMAAGARRELAEVIARHGIVTVEDQCSVDLTLRGPAVASTLGRLVPPELLLTVGTTSKLFWGGLRVGWIRGAPERIRGLTEMRKALDLGGSVLDQLSATAMLRRVDEARSQRRVALREAVAASTAQIRAAFPQWTWTDPVGGSCLWVDTGRDAVELVEIGKRVGVQLIAGPSFSAHGGQRTHLRLPVWHEPETLGRALEALAAAV